MATITSPRTSSPAPSATTHTPQITTSSPSQSSSARTSLDQQRQNINATTPNNPSQRRNRAALRDYYNLKAKAPQRTESIASTHSDVSSVATEQATGPTTAATAQLDDPTFDAEEWIKTLLSQSSLRDILKTEATLVSEIRNLDGERKALVYDNYRKLINAVGTIGEMQRGMNGTDSTVGIGGLRTMATANATGKGGGLERVQELGAKMDGLRATVRELAGSTGKDEKSSEERLRRREEREGHKKRRDLVRWVLDAPKRLSALIDAGKEEEAEKEWSVVKGYLDKWNGVKGVEEVSKLCEDVLAGSEEEEVGNSTDLKAV